MNGVGHLTRNPDGSLTGEVGDFVTVTSKSASGKVRFAAVKYGDVPLQIQPQGFSFKVQEGPTPLAVVFQGEREEPVSLEEVTDHGRYVLATFRYTMSDPIALVMVIGTWK